MSFTHQAEFNVPGLPPDAANIDIVPDLHNVSLVSISKLCDAGCIATFDNHNHRVIITHNQKIIWTGKKNPATTLCEMNMQSVAFQ